MKSNQNPNEYLALTVINIFYAEITKILKITKSS